LSVSFWNRLRPPELYWPKLRFDDLRGLLRIVCGHGYDNGVVPCCRRYLRFVDSLSHRSDSLPTFPLPSLRMQIPVQFKRYDGGPSDGFRTGSRRTPRPDQSSHGSTRPQSKGRGFSFVCMSSSAQPKQMFPHPPKQASGSCLSAESNTVPMKDLYQHNVRAPNAIRILHSAATVPNNLGSV
jgi:hypothetical protein